MGVVKFNNDGTKVFVGLNNAADYHLITLNSADGSLLSSLRQAAGDQWNDYIRQNGIAIDSKDNIYMAINRNKWEVVKLTDPNTLASSWDIQDGNGTANSLIIA